MSIQSEKNETLKRDEWYIDAFRVAPAEATFPEDRSNRSKIQA